MQLKDIINPHYLSKEFILKTRRKFDTQKHVPYIQFDSFLREDVHEKIYKTIQQKGYAIIQDHSKHGVGKKSITCSDPFLTEVYRVFESKKFEKYLSLFFADNVERFFYTNGEMFVGQLYEAGDFLDWHIDGDTQIIGSFVYYVYNKDRIVFTSSSGGNLELGIAQSYKNTDGYYEDIITYESIDIHHNTLGVMKNNRNSFHRVPQINEDSKRIIVHCSLQLVQ